MPLPLFLGLAAAAASAGLMKKSKENSEIINVAEARCAAEAKEYKIEKEASELQQKAMRILIKHAFYKNDKTEKPPISSDWKHIPNNTHIYATRKYSLLSWGEYSFYTKNAVYYHHKSKGIHDFLYFDKINNIDISTGVVDYGKEHKKKDISLWPKFDKEFVLQISNIWGMHDAIDCSVIEFCFNNCSDFQKDLSFFKTNAIKSVFRRQCQDQNYPSILCENFDHINILHMENGHIELQYWEYFPRVENVIYNDEDTEHERFEKELEQECREQEAAERERNAQLISKALNYFEKQIAELFQQSLFNLFGTFFEIENITFIKEPNFTYEGPSMLEKISNTVDTLNNVANSAQAFLMDYADKHNPNR